MSGYSVFNALSYPVAVIDNQSNPVFTNSEFQRLYNAGNFTGIDFSYVGDRIFFCRDKGVVKCFRCVVSLSGENRIISFFDITSTVNRKAMLEISGLDTDRLTHNDLKKVIEKNRRLADVIDIMESGVFIEGASGSIVQMNNSFLKMIADKGSISFKANADSDTIHSILADFSADADYFLVKDRIMKKNPDAVYKDELRFKDGRVFSRSYFPLNIDSRTKGCLWKFKDITARRMLESFRTELEAMITALESSENVGLYLQYQGYRFVNNGLLNLLQESRENVKRKGIDTYIESVESEIVSLRRKDGSLCKAQMFSDEVSVAGLKVRTVSLIDVTDKLALTESLKKNEAKFSSMFHNNTAVMLMFNPYTMDIIEANDSAIKFYGYYPEKLFMHRMCDLTLSSDQCSCRDILDGILEKRSGSNIHVRQVCADGSVRDVLLMMTPLEHDGEIIMFVILEDISDRIKYQKELEQVNENLQKIVEEEINKRRRNEELLMEKMRLAEIGEMIGSIAHQWRQPLNTLGILIQDITDAQEFGELTGEYLKDLVAKGMYQIDYMSKTIDDFRDFFKPSKASEIFDVKECVGQVLSIVMPQLKNKSIECVVTCRCGIREIVDSDTEDLQICKDHDMKISGYPNEFKQVLMNIISNSKDAVAERPVRKISIYITSDPDNVTVAVEDTGGGIPDVVIDRIFDPYFTTKGEKGGTGIGLYMSKAIIEANMKGSLAVENTLQGCRFIIKMKRSS